MVGIRLPNGIRLNADTDLETFAELYQEALQRTELIEIVNDRGKVRIINPFQVLYFEELPQPPR